MLSYQTPWVAFPGYPLALLSSLLPDPHTGTENTAGNPKVEQGLGEGGQWGGGQNTFMILQVELEPLLSQKPL